MVKTMANDIQIGGSHYRGDGSRSVQHWDLMARFSVGYFPSVITKYVERHADKNGLEDVEKSLHYTRKWIEVGRLTYDSPSSEAEAREIIAACAEYSDAAGLDQYQSRILTSALMGMKNDVLLTVTAYRDHCYGEDSDVVEARPGTPEDGGHHASASDAEDELSSVSTELAYAGIAE